MKIQVVREGFDLFDETTNVVISTFQTFFQTNYTFDTFWKEEKIVWSRQIGLGKWGPGIRTSAVTETPLHDRLSILIQLSVLT